MNVLGTLITVLAVVVGAVVLIPILGVVFGLVVAIGSVLLWLLPIVLIAVSDKVGTAEKILWILAIIFLVITVRAVLFPVFVKQIKSQRAMQTLQPKVKALQQGIARQ